MSNGQDYWGGATEGVAEEGGGGVYGKARITLAHWVFAPGVTGNDRQSCMFVPKKNTKAGRAAARKLALKFASDHGVGTNNVRWCAVTRLYRDECVRAGGEGVEWQSDRFETVPLWTLNLKDVKEGTSRSAAKEVMAAIAENDVPGGKDFYGRFIWPYDPYKQDLGEEGKTGENLEGEADWPRYCRVAEVYPNAKTCLAAAGADEEIPFDGDEDEDQPPVPELWEGMTETWIEQVKDVMAMKAPQRRKMIAEASEELSATPEEVKAWIEYLKESE